MHCIYMYGYGNMKFSIISTVAATAIIYVVHRDVDAFSVYTHCRKIIMTHHDTSSSLTSKQYDRSFNSCGKAK